MSFWNCVGKFLLLRWLFGKLKGKNNDLPDYNHQNSYLTHNYHDDLDTHLNNFNDDWNSLSFNHFDEEQDDYDMMDDF